jgi:hypothetical protein
MRIMEAKELKTYRGRFWTVTKGMPGYFAVQMWWNPEYDGFWEPYDTGIGRYESRKDAELEAQWCAEDYDQPYVGERW